jgi:hypothetical protein
MQTIDHRAYFSRREAQERRFADAAIDCAARHAHRVMARRYADLALALPVQSDSIVTSPRAASAGASASIEPQRRVKTATPLRDAAGHS